VNEDHRKAITCALVASTVWGTVYVTIKVGLNHGMPPLSFAGIRFFASGLILLGIAWAMGRLKVERSDIWKLALLGLFQTGLQNALFFTGVHLTNAGVSAIFINLQPFFVILFAPLFFEGSKVTPIRMFGVIVGFGGVVAVTGGWGSLPDGYSLGILSLVGAAITWAFSNIAVKRMIATRDPIVVTSVQMTLGAAPLVLVGRFVEGPLMAGADTTAWLMLGYLAVFATWVPFFAWYKALSFGEVGRVSVFAFLLPVYGVVSGWLFLNEKMSVGIALGMVMVAAGIALVNVNARLLSRGTP
jgi:drug/metabolite transporter (DMT)-like permease